MGTSCASNALPHRGDAAAVGDMGMDAASCEGLVFTSQAGGLQAPGLWAGALLPALPVQPWGPPRLPWLWLSVLGQLSSASAGAAPGQPLSLCSLLLSLLPPRPWGWQGNAPHHWPPRCGAAPGQLGCAMPKRSHPTALPRTRPHALHGCGTERV